MTELSLPSPVSISQRVFESMNPSSPPTLDQLAQLLAAPEPNLAALRSWLERSQKSTFPPDDPNRQAAHDALTLDLDRARRCGYPEVIYGPGKSPETVVHAVGLLMAQQQDALVTRVDAAQQLALQQAIPQGSFNPEARTWRCMQERAEEDANQTQLRPVAVVTAGTSDLPVAEEAAETLSWMRVPVRRINDVGVAGPHRLVARAPELRECGAIVVVAGMEGALPSVVAGHVACPVIGVPTSVGYGANFQGVSALLSMLNSCAANVAVVNIDAGFKGGYMAVMIAWNAGAQKHQA